MHLARTTITLAAAALLTTTLTGATSRATTHRADACTPAWKLAATPVPAADYTQLTGPAAVLAKDAWFPGVTYPSTGGTVPWVLHWDGHSLRETATIPQGPFEIRDAESGSFDSATDGWVLGTATLSGPGPSLYPQYAARWHAGRWTVIPLAISPHPLATGGLQLEAVTSLSPGDAWAVGRFSAGLLPLGALVEHWDGSRWSAVPNPLSSTAGAALLSVTAVSAANIWAVGRQQNADGATVPLAEHWNGTAWSVVSIPAGNAPSLLYAVSADGPDDVWATGARTEPGTGNVATGMVEHWNGTAWGVVTGLPDLGNSELPNVYAASPTDVWTTVYAPRPNTDFGVEEFLHWDGTSWTTVPVPGPDEYDLDYEYAGLDGSGPGNIWAAGWENHQPGGTTTPLIAHLSCGS
jgi:hypothetical protein